MKIGSYSMSRIEELVYSAYDHGKREALFNEIAILKKTNPSMRLEELYDLAYQNVMKV
jgi:hypothetical protein